MIHYDLSFFTSGKPVNLAGVCTLLCIIPLISFALLEHVHGGKVVGMKNTDKMKTCTICR